MVPRVKLAYDNVCGEGLVPPLSLFVEGEADWFFPQRVFPIIHPSRRNLTAIRGYLRLGGLPDNPRTDPQDRAWFGPHDRLFVEEESEPVDFVPGPEHGELLSSSLPPGLPQPFRTYPPHFGRHPRSSRRKACHGTMNVDHSFFSVWCWGWDGAGDLDGPDVDPIWEKMPNRTFSSDAIKIQHRRDLRQF